MTMHRILPFTVVLVLAPSHVLADAIMVTRAMTASTIAEFRVEEDSVTVELEIGVGDLPAFRNLLPDELYEGLGFEPRAWSERLADFFRHDLVIRVGADAPLPARLTELRGRRRILRDEITGEPLAASNEEEGEPVIFSRLRYDLPGKPPTLTFTPPGREDVGTAASIGFVVYHRGLPVNDFRYLGTSEVLRLDWTDPWYSRFDNKNLWRQYKSPINVFLYVEPFEVRHEIIVRPFDLQQWVDLGLEGRRSIPVGLQADLKQQVVDFLTEHSHVTVDGERRQPILDRIHFLRRTLKTSAVISPPEELDIVSATLGVIFAYPTDGLPQEATMTWDLWSPRVERIPAAATDEAGPLPYTLTPEDNILKWQNFLQNPTLPTLAEVDPPPSPIQRALPFLGWLGVLAILILILLQLRSGWRGQKLSRGTAIAVALLVAMSAVSFAAARPAGMSDRKVERIMGGLLHNIYRAFDFRDESTIYDVLERSVTGDLLTRTYLETRRGLELANQGGARAKVKDIEMIEVETRRREGRGFTTRCVWNVSGSVGHWGHVHRRTNRYEAKLTVQPVEGSWKITSLELLQEERL